ncbi:hypothetical protein HZH68_010985 [Vespula germanica]|uniref:Uncharacterized protein n=1 Tax=Vespula germanica TaxID=30212 RepID=A0A834N015_VESGE|nr:hypothetical protein HZH68_010985 [Vespula germanica]
MCKESISFDRFDVEKCGEVAYAQERFKAIVENWYDGGLAVDVGAFAIAGNLHCRSALSLMKQPLLPQRHKKKETHDTRREKVENGNCNCVFDPAKGVKSFLVFVLFHLKVFQMN